MPKQTEFSCLAKNYEPAKEIKLHNLKACTWRKALKKAAKLYPNGFIITKITSAYFKDFIKSTSATRTYEPKLED